MPFAKQSEIELERIAEEVLSRLRASDVDPISATRGKSFAEMERAARAVAQRVATRLTAQMLAESSDEAPEFAPCPKCHHNWRVTRKKRLIVTADGRSSTSNRPHTARIVAVIFFPRRPQLGLGERKYSPELQRKLTETTARTKSFAQTAHLAELWCEQGVTTRTVTRVACEIGHELVAKRDQRVDDFTHHRCQAEGPDPKHECVAVFVDGGRSCVRNRVGSAFMGSSGEKIRSRDCRRCRR